LSSRQANLAFGAQCKSYSLPPDIYSTYYKKVAKVGLVAACFQLVTLLER
jgi:hypothetical protein